jgi:hypothetical protein
VFRINDLRQTASFDSSRADRAQTDCEFFNLSVSLLVMPRRRWTLRFAIAG